MISRRLLRVKALQVLYAFKASENTNIRKGEQELMFSIEKSYDLYHLILLLLVDIVHYAGQRIEIARSKYFPTPEEVNPNTKFIDNRVIRELTANRGFYRYLETTKLSWAHQGEMIRELYRQLLEWSVFKDYLSSTDDSFNADRKFINRCIQDFLLPNEVLEQTLEEQSIYWNDDLEFIGSMITKTLGRWKGDGDLQLMSMFSSEDDRVFVIELFRKTIMNSGEYRELIRRFSENWDFERLAVMDILIMEMAIVEAVHFPSIPTRVTLNEYIEISKYYSTDKSSLFINGILDKVFAELKNSKKIVKTGRGLIGEV